MNEKVKEVLNTQKIPAGLVVLLFVGLNKVHRTLVCYLLRFTVHLGKNAMQEDSLLTFMFYKFLTLFGRGFYC